MARRGRLILFVLFTMMLAILVNLYLITLRNPASAVGTKQSSWTLTVSTARGTIYDRNQIPLVNTEYQLQAACSPDTEHLQLIKKHVSKSNYEYAVSSIKNGTPFVLPLISSPASSEGLLPLESVKRYANRQIAPHIIGYCRDGAGVSGIEMVCDDTLKQSTGTQSVTFAINGQGQQMSGITPIIRDTTADSVGGVSLTLDSVLQTILEDATGAVMSKGAVVILDPQSGEILGCASYPSYHPENVSLALEGGNGALINRALSLYDCGSVFKIVTTSAALEWGVGVDKQFICDGDIDVGGTVFHCHNRSGHGVISMDEAFAVSCNTYFIQLAQEIGADAIYSMANTLGFGRKITLAEGFATPIPLLPERETLNQPAALANLSFGQGYLMTTPLHIAQIVSAIANDGMMPSVQLLRSYIDKDRNETIIDKQSSFRVLSKENAIILREMLQQVVEKGTGHAAKPNYTTAAGKTGTAETGQKNNGTPVVQSWFAGYLPAESPQYVIVVLAEDSGTTGENASYIFCEISNNLVGAGLLREGK